LTFIPSSSARRGGVPSSMALRRSGRGGGCAADATPFCAAPTSSAIAGAFSQQRRNLAIATTLSLFLGRCTCRYGLGGLARRGAEAQEITRSARKPHGQLHQPRARSLSATPVWNAQSARAPVPKSFRPAPARTHPVAFRRLEACSRGPGGAPGPPQRPRP
jgi:hypothetical protein